MGMKIIGTGRCVPEKIITNEDLSQTLDTSDEWIFTRTGIKKRHIATYESVVDLATGAARQALLQAKVTPEEVDAILVATSSAEYAFPNVASQVQERIGANHAMCLDMSAACTGFIYALHCADALVRTGQYRTILVIGAEVMSKQMDWSDRSVCVLFGDGAGAVLVKKDDSRLTAGRIHSEGKKAEVLACDRNNVVMNGQEVFRFAVKMVPQSIQEVVDMAHLSLQDVNYFLLHQANVRIIEAIAKRMKLPKESFLENVRNYGNTSAASIPILLDEYNRIGQFKERDRMILSGFGAGLSWGSILLEW